METSSRSPRLGVGDTSIVILAGGAGRLL